MARSIEDHDAPCDRAENKTDEVDADERDKSLPADGESGIHHLAPAEMNDEDGGDREPYQRADDQASSHESAARKVRGFRPIASIFVLTKGLRRALSSASGW